MDDVVDSDGDLDENKISDGEQTEPNYSVFNPIEMFDPTFELGMLFSTKAELRKVIQSHSIKTKRYIEGMYSR